MPRYLILLLFPLLALACTPKPNTFNKVVGLDADEPFEYERFRPKNVQRPTEYTFARQRNLNPNDYLPDTSNARYLPLRYLHVNFHIMNSSDTLYPFYGQKAVDEVKEVLGYTNDMLRKTPALWLTPEGVDVPALPRQLHFNIVDKTGTDEAAIYEHYDDELYYYLHNGKHRNRADRRVVEKYALNQDSVLNIFIMGPPRDSIESKTFKLPGTEGIFLGDAIKVTGWLENNRRPWELRGIVGHEIGHALGLGHAWGRDGCDDTPIHKNNAWSQRGKNYGPGKTSNNLMDYSKDQQALTPCQIGRMHARMNDITSRQRKWLLPRWCKYANTESIRVTKDLNWEGARDFNSDIYVRRGYTLRINNRVHLPEQAAIYVDPGATLILGPKAVIHNSCGGTWGGIRVGVSESGYQGEVVTDPLATLLNVVE